MIRNKILILFIFIVIVGGFLIESKSIHKIIYPKKYSDYVEKYSEEFNLDEHLVYSVIKAESKFKKNATSHRGAKGLMQISDVTSEWAAKELNLGKNYDIYNPDINIKIGCWYLNQLFKEFKTLDLVIAAYNGGSGNVNKWLKDENHSKDGENLHSIPFKETSNYLEKVTLNYKYYNEIYREKGKANEEK